jgi:hypothetical protein
VSVQAISAVLQESASRLGDRLVLLAIANHAKADGSDAWPGIAQLATEARLSERQVQRALRNLQDLGELEVRYKAGPRGTNLYDVLPGHFDRVTNPTVTPTNRRGSTTNRTKDDDAHVTRTTIEPSEEPSGTLAPIRRDDLFESLFVAQTLQPYGPAAKITVSERAKINTATKQAREAGYGADDIQRAIVGWPQAMGDARITALGLVANLSRCLNAANGARANVTQSDAALNNAIRAMRERDHAAI